MKNKIINWGMIGVGNVTLKKSAPSFNKVGHSKLLAVASRRYEKAKEFAARNGIERCYEYVEEMMADKELDAIYIATPPSSHREYALQAISAGKTVYIEKPMALNSAECEEINSAAEAAGVKVFVAYYRRALPYFAKVRELIESEKLGRILSLHLDQHSPMRIGDDCPDNLPWRVKPEISGGGYFHDIGSHALDIVFFLLGNPLSVKGHASNIAGLYDVPDTISMSAELPNSVLMTGSWSFIIPERYVRDRCTIKAEEGQLSFSIFSFEDIEIETGGVLEQISVKAPEHIQQPLIQSIVDELRGEGASASTGENGAFVSAVMEHLTE